MQQDQQPSENEAYGAHQHHQQQEENDYESFNTPLSPSQMLNIDAWAMVAPDFGF